MQTNKQINHIELYVANVFYWGRHLKDNNKFWLKYNDANLHTNILQKKKPKDICIGDLKMIQFI